MASLKSVLRTAHRWLGLGSGLLIVFVCLTGSLLAFEQELEQAGHPARYFVTPTAAPLPLARLVAAVRAHQPQARITGLKVYADPARTVEVSLAGGPGQGRPGAGRPAGKGQDKGAGKDKDGGGPRLYLNPYTAVITGEVNPRDTFFHTVEQLHRGLVAGKTGKLVMGVNASILLFMLSTGLVLWWPATRRALGQRLRVQRGSSRKRLTYDLHVVLGFYTALFLLIMALTGVGMSFDWVGQGINQLTHSPLKRPEPPLSARPASGTAALQPEAALTVARREVSEAAFYQLQWPKEPTGSIRVTTLRPGRTPENATDELYLDQYSGRVIGRQSYEQRSVGQRIRGLFKPVHTGAVFGWPTKALSLVVSLLGATFPVTGTLLWLNRRRKTRPKARHLQAV